MTLIEIDAAEYLLWMKIHNYATSTIRCRERYLAYFVAFAHELEADDVLDVTIDLLKDCQRLLFTHKKKGGQPLSFGTQAQRLVAVTQFFKWLRRTGHLESDPAIDLEMPRPSSRLPEATLSAKEISRVMSIVNVKKPLGLRDRAVLEVFYSCGLRRGEVISLTIRDIDIERGTLFVRSGKGSKDRYVPVGERALFWLQLYLGLVRPQFDAKSGSQSLFLSSVGTPLCPDWLSRRVSRYFAQAGIEKNGSCHLLRHSVATLMLEGGADIRYVAEMLGHARLETTQRYTRVSIDRLRAVHATTHPAAGLDVAMASELCALLPAGASIFGKEMFGERIGRMR